MSLFGFVKDIGKKLFDNEEKPEEAAERIKAHIEANNPGVEDLHVTYDSGYVGLRGVCDSVEAHQKCILMAGNVKGVKDVITPGLKVKDTEMVAADDAEDTENQLVPQSDQKVEFYVIQSGDSLSKIAKEYYGNAMDYPKIFEANREVIEDPDLIYPGQKIRIPLEG